MRKRFVEATGFFQQRGQVDVYLAGVRIKLRRATQFHDGVVQLPSTFKCDGLIEVVFDRSLIADHHPVEVSFDRGLMFNGHERELAGEMRNGGRPKRECAISVIGDLCGANAAKAEAATASSEGCGP